MLRLLRYEMLSVAVVFIWCGCGGGTTTARDGKHAWTSDFEGFKAIEGIDFIHLITETKKHTSCISEPKSLTTPSLCTIRFETPQTVVGELTMIADSLQTDIAATANTSKNTIYRYSSAVGENNNHYLLFLVKLTTGCSRIALVVNHEGVDTGYDWVKDVKHLYFPEKIEKVIRGQFIRMSYEFSLAAPHNQYFGAPDSSFPDIFLAFELNRCPGGNSRDTTNAMIRYLKQRI